MPDFAFSGYYYHSRSGLFLTATRAYDGITARWLNRDPLSESGGLNLYAYVGNNPISNTDTLGLDPTIRDDFRIMVPGGRAQPDSSGLGEFFAGTTLLLGGYALAGLEIPAGLAGTLAALRAGGAVAGATAAGSSCPLSGSGLGVAGSTVNGNLAFSGNRALALINKIANPSESGSLVKGLNALIQQARQGGANVLEITGGSDNLKLLRLLNSDLFKNKFSANVTFTGPFLDSGKPFYNVTITIPLE